MEIHLVWYLHICIFILTPEALSEVKPVFLILNIKQISY